jgi:hypothetical protein
MGTAKDQIKSKAVETPSNKINFPNLPNFLLIIKPLTHVLFIPHKTR